MNRQVIRMIKEWREREEERERRKGKEKRNEMIVIQPLGLHFRFPLLVNNTSFLVAMTSFFSFHLFAPRAIVLMLFSSILIFYSFNPLLLFFFLSTKFFPSSIHPSLFLRYLHFSNYQFYSFFQKKRSQYFSFSFSSLTTFYFLLTLTSPNFSLHLSLFVKIHFFVR